MSPLEFARRAFDTAAAGAHALGAAIDRRKAALPRLCLILDGGEIGTELDELFGAVWALTLGFWLLLPFHTFAQTPAFRVLNALSFEGLWALAITGFALWRLDSIVMNRPCARHTATISAVVLWSCFAVLFFFSSIASPGGILFCVLAAFEALSYRNQGVGVRRWASK